MPGQLIQNAAEVHGKALRLWRAGLDGEARSLQAPDWTFGSTGRYRWSSAREGGLQPEAEGNSDIRVCGIFDDRDDSRSPPVVAGVPKLGTLDALLAFARSAEIDMLIVTLPLSAEARIRGSTRS